MGTQLLSSFHWSNQLLALAPIQLRIRTNRYQTFQSNLTLLDFLIFLKIICTGVGQDKKWLKTKLIWLKGNLQYTELNIFQKFLKTDEIARP